MPTDSLPPNEPPASPPLHQSLWFPVAPESRPESPQDEPVDPSAPRPAAPAVNGLGWRAPKRVRVPIFGRDAAAENTTPPEAPAVYALSGSDADLKELAQAHGAGIRVLSVPREPTANDETVHQLREHIVPDPMPPDMDDDESGMVREHEQGMIPPLTYDEMVRAFPNVLAAAPPDDPDFQEVARTPTPASQTWTDGDQPVTPGCYAVAVCWDTDEGVFPMAVGWDGSAWDRKVPIIMYSGPHASASAAADWADAHDPEASRPAGGPTDADCVGRFQGVVRFAPPDPIPPPKEAQAAQASADPRGRDDATPNDGVVPQGSLSAHFDPATVAEMFRCAYWSDGRLEIRTSGGERFLLSDSDTLALLRYVGDMLSARARASA